MNAEILQLLQTYGAWGVAVAEAIAIVAMAKHIVKLHEEQREEAKELTTALVETRDAMKEQRRALELFVTRQSVGGATLPTYETTEGHRR